MARVSGVSLAADRLPGHLVVKWRPVRASAYHVRWSTAPAALGKSRIVVSRDHRRTDLGAVTASTHYVQVRAVQSNGRRGPWSVPSRLKTPKPVVVAPAPTPTPTPTPTPAPAPAPAPVVAPQLSVSVV
ncbi:hypothetical protein, partial [Marmoricola sp. Leaf446]|uniref:hypothetical protein n=1 Tax=Marmoricola sp. Leaf446 TaxID=1736379 RepID=UPI000701FEBF